MNTASNQGDEFFQQPEWGWKWIFPQSLQKGTQPAPHLEIKISESRSQFRQKHC